MRYVMALCAGLLCACLQAGERQRFRVVNRVPAFEVVNKCSTCTYCTDCKCAVGACPGKCPVVEPAALPVYAAPVVSSCPGGNCAAPVQSRGLFGLRRW